MTPTPAQLDAAVQSLDADYLWSLVEGGASPADRLVRGLLGEVLLRIAEQRGGEVAR